MLLSTNATLFTLVFIAMFCFTSFFINSPRNKQILNATNNKHVICNPSEIDVVFTWVDMFDEQWVQKFNEKRKVENLSAKTSTDANRFRDFEQLRFAIRSVKQFAPWVRNIFIVTDNQVPHWFNESIGKKHNIFIIDHKDIFPKRLHSNLPVFNSYAIELNLHRIQGLSECFLYLQDDQFFMRPLDLDFFFNAQDNTINHFVAAHSIVEDRAKNNPWLNTWINTHDTFCNEFNISSVDCNHEKWKLSDHSPQLYKRSWLYELETKFELEYDQTRLHAFRRENDLTITMSLFNHYAMFKKFDQVHFSHSEQFGFVQVHDAIQSTIMNLITLQNNEQYVIGCIQDSMQSTNYHSISSVLAFYNSLVPQKEPFEQTDPENAAVKEYEFTERMQKLY